MKILAGLVLLAVVAVNAQMLETKTYATSGHPTEALETPDGRYVLVTVNRTGQASGLDVFHAELGTLERVAFQPLGGHGVQGILLIPHSRILAVGISNGGVAFLSLSEAVKGKARPVEVTQGDKPGSGYLAATPDGQFLFVANEYGDGGNIGVIALHRDHDGNVNPEAVSHIPTPNTTPGITISADGTRLYTEGEVAPPSIVTNLAAHGVTELEQHCTQGALHHASPDGVLYVIDVGRAVALTSKSSRQDALRTLVGIEDAGCSPVRAAASKDGKLIYVTARGDNKVLIFDAKALHPYNKRAFLGAIPSGGEAPVGIELFRGDKAMVVANSNRFTGGSGSAVVFDLTEPATPVLRQTITTAGFPRNFTISPDGKTLYLTIFNGNQLMVLTLK